VKKLVLVLLLVCASCGWKETPCTHVVRSDLRPLESPLDGAQLLRQVAERYAHLGSYSDTGCVFRSFSGRLGHSDRHPFETVFARPSTFRFECTETRFRVAKQRFAIWTEKGAVRSWWSVSRKTRTHPITSHALRAASAIAGGSADTVSRLLLGPDSSAPWIMRLRNLRVLGSQRLPDGADCYVLEGEGYQGYPVQVWVERTTLAIHRMHDVLVISHGVHVDTTITYQPRFNPKIDPASIRFEPPRNVDPFGLHDTRRELVCNCG
jgi:outer membrane lipoprotein-sorting protein